MIVIRVYISHSIRGPKGKDATKEDMQKNCDRILAIVATLRYTHPDIDFYVPAEHEDFVGRAYHRDFITEKQILMVDCMIIDACDAVIIYTPSDDAIVQGGRLVEKAHAYRTGKTICEFKDVIQANAWLNLYKGGY